ncbi:MAG: ATP-binding protein [Calothrix sp. SM1_5_4]|nr:ATP-binding protein [Calothrix sp. SM1_5_4]
MIKEKDKRFARIKVSDRGRGIPSEFLPHIFHRFSQADSTSTRAHGGLGLGLSIVHSLVEMQQGTVQTENAKSGSGAIFTVTFPIVSFQSGVAHFGTEVGSDSLLTENGEKKEPGEST